MSRLSLPHIKSKLLKAAEAIKNADALVFTAGAGMGCDSGLPDFRGPEGFWRAYPPIKEKGLTFPEVSTPHWFEDDPTFAWGFFAHRMNLYRSTQPHEGFSILKKWGESKKNGYFVFTSNVDGHFQKAGFPEDKVVECHGSLNYLQTITGDGNIWPVPDDMCLTVDENTMHTSNALPMGPPGVTKEKRVLARPNVLMFNDWHFIHNRTEQQEDRMWSFVKGLSSSTSSLVVIEIGAGLAVPTVRYTGESIVSGFVKGCLIRINPRESEIERTTGISLPAYGLECLKAIDDLI